MVWEFAVIPFIIGQEISVYFWGVMENYRAWRNFCLDGLFGGERMPHTGAFAVKYITTRSRSLLAKAWWSSQLQQLRSSGYLP
jgi:hypothetical protein